MAGEIRRRVVIEVDVDSRSLAQTASAFRRVAQDLGIMGAATRVNLKQLQQMPHVFDVASMHTLRFRESLARVANTIRSQILPAFNRFNMNALSLLFAGMGLQMTFGRVVNTVMDLFGASEAWNTLWLELLGDAVVPLVDMLWRLVDVISNLDPKTKQLIASIFIIGAFVGSIMMTMSLVYQVAYAIFHIVSPLASILAAAGAGTAAAWIGAATIFAVILLLLGNIIKSGFNLKDALIMTIKDIITILAKLMDFFINLWIEFLTPVGWLIKAYNAITGSNIPIPKFTGASTVGGFINERLREWTGVNEVGIAESLLGGGNTTIVNIDTLIGTDPEKLRDSLGRAMGSGTGYIPSVG